jgi:hypothetical protein
MAVRTLKIFCLVMLALFCSGQALACFGPKLFLGVPDDAEGQVLTSIVAIYVKEKTGVETNRVDIGRQDVAEQIVADKLDYGFSGNTDGLQIILSVEGLPPLVSGPRIQNDLQFTTVAPALRRLQKLLKMNHIEQILKDVQDGDLPMAAARKFLMAQRWI